MQQCQAIPPSQAQNATCCELRCALSSLHISLAYSSQHAFGGCFRLRREAAVQCCLFRIVQLTDAVYRLATFLTIAHALSLSHMCLLQIARITAGTSVSPAGLFEADTDAEPVNIKVHCHPAAYKHTAASHQFPCSSISASLSPSCITVTAVMCFRLWTNNARVPLNILVHTNSLLRQKLWTVLSLRQSKSS